MDSEEPIVSGSLDDSPTEDVELNNKEGSDMGETPEEAPLFGKAKKSEPVVTPAPSAEPVAAAPVAAPKKKSHAGSIITIIVLVLLLVGGGVAAFLWMMWHESAETSINDAMAKTFEVKDRTISGTLTTGGSAGGIKVTFDGVQSDGNFGGSGKLSFAGLVNVKFNASMMKDGDIYFKLDGVKDALKTLPIGDIIGSFAGGSSNTNGMDVSELISELVGPVAEVIDGEWIKVSADDLGGITKQGSECDYNGVLGIFSGDAAKEVTEAYKKNTFIVQKKDSEVEDVAYDEKHDVDKLRRIVRHVHRHEHLMGVRDPIVVEESHTDDQHGIDKQEVAVLALHEEPVEDLVDDCALLAGFIAYAHRIVDDDRHQSKGDGKADRLKALRQSNGDGEGNGEGRMGAWHAAGPPDSSPVELLFDRPVQKRFDRLRQKPRAGRAAERLVVQQLSQQRTASHRICVRLKMDIAGMNGCSRSFTRCGGCSAGPWQ